MNSLFPNKKQNFLTKKVKPQYSLLNMRAESTRSKGLEIPCQNTFKDKPAFIKSLIKVLVARIKLVLGT